MYHSQQVIGFGSVLCSERGLDVDGVHIAVLIKITTIIAVCEIVGTVVGAVHSVYTGRVGKYHTIGVVQRVQHRSRIHLLVVEIVAGGPQAQFHTPVVRL